MHSLVLLGRTADSDTADSDTADSDKMGTTDTADSDKLGLTDTPDSDRLGSSALSVGRDGPHPRRAKDA
jgi:hypothetical protein